MRSAIKSVLKRFARLFDVPLAVLVVPASMIMRSVRQIGVQRLPLCRKILEAVGVFPIRDHYYEPQFTFRPGAERLCAERKLPGIDWNIDEQRDLVRKLRYASELRGIDASATKEGVFHWDNDSFGAIDAGFLYQFIRLHKPRTVMEIGSGYSTLIARRALEKNRLETPENESRHVCVEPFEMPWLESAGVEVIRQRVEDIGVDAFSGLRSGDLLFIDSSHVIRPRGDVLFEYLELLPVLAKGVFVHIHDIFTPRNYLKRFVIDEVKLWNEQYLLEAFLTENNRWKIVAALNYLQHNFSRDLLAISPAASESEEPGSIYIQRIMA